MPDELEELLRWTDEHFASYSAACLSMDSHAGGASAVNTICSWLHVHLVSFSFVLDDLTSRTDDELRARAMQEIGKLALLLMRWARSGPELMARLVEWSDLLRAVWEAPDGRYALGMVIRYTTHACNLRVRQASVGPRSARNTLLGSERAPQAQAEPGEMRRQQACAV
ncbi:MAG: hypothetical protein MUF54_14625 [Polyangiaceae bacterium]|nr:hypothetical protein [Polyangiaceae bacterium]